MYAQFNRFELQLTLGDAISASHPGQCDADVIRLSQKPTVKRQLAKLDPEQVKAELREFGAWDDEELADHTQNLHRLIWIAAGNIAEESRCTS